MQKPYDQDPNVKVKENSVSSNGKSIKYQLKNMKEKISKLLSPTTDLKLLIPNDESLNLICVIPKKNCVDCLENNFQIEY
jgi:hypothetical protein